MEMPGFEPGASYMQSMRSTTELHPHKNMILLAASDDYHSTQYNNQARETDKDDTLNI